MFNAFFTKVAGWFLKSKLNLQGDSQMDDSKKWYQSKTVIASLVTALMGLYMTIAPQLHWPAVPEWVFSILGAIGVYSRVTADTKIG